MSKDLKYFTQSRNKWRRALTSRTAVWDLSLQLENANKEIDTLKQELYVREREEEPDRLRGVIANLHKTIERLSGEKKKLIESVKDQRDVEYELEYRLTLIGNLQRLVSEKLIHIEKLEKVQRGMGKDISDLKDIRSAHESRGRFLRQSNSDLRRENETLLSKLENARKELAIKRSAPTEIAELKGRLNRYKYNYEALQESYNLVRKDKLGLRDKCEVLRTDLVGWKYLAGAAFATSLFLLIALIWTINS